MPELAVGQGLQLDRANLADPWRPSLIDAIITREGDSEARSGVSAALVGQRAPAEVEVELRRTDGADLLELALRDIDRVLEGLRRG